MRNPAPWILLVTIALAAATFLVVDSQSDDVSGRTQGTAALIVIGVGIAVMVLAQRAWTARARRAAALDAVRGAREAAAAGTITDAARLEPNALFAALAIYPLDEQALAAGGDRGWALAERSQRNATAMTLLIVVLMVPALALQEVRLIALAAVPIVGYAVVLAARVIRPGGTLDQAYAAHDAMLEPLGLSGSERPDVVFVPRLAGEGMQSQVVGPTVLSGQRHGRAVEIRIDGSRTETRVAGAYPAFELKGHRQRVRAEGELPPAVERIVAELHASPRWTSMKLTAGPDGIVVTRRSGAEQPWLYDLWLAERLATAEVNLR
jgi:hypothetical protein